MTNTMRSMNAFSRSHGYRLSGVGVGLALLSHGCVGSRDADSTFDPLPDLNARVDTNGSSDSRVTLPPEGDAAPGLTDASPLSELGVRINEVAASGDPEDWVELINLSKGAISLDGYALTDAPDGSPVPLASGLVIEPGALVVLDVSELTFGFKIGSDEALYLYDPTGALIDSADWDEGASPEGGSFSRKPHGTGDFVTTTPDTRGEPNDDAAIPTPDAGSVDGDQEMGDVVDAPDDDILTEPDSDDHDDGGAPDVSSSLDSSSTPDSGTLPEEPPLVVINEVTATGSDEIELLNLSAITVDLSGWAIVDADYILDPTTLDHRYDFPAGSAIGPGKYLVLEGEIDHPFGVGKADRLQLLAPGDVVIDDTSWTEPAAATSWCRIPNGTGDFEVCEAATFGVSNGGPPLPGVLALNEVTSSGDDLIELVNLGPGPALVGGHAVSDDGYLPEDLETMPLHYTVLTSTAVLAVGERLALMKGTDHAFGLGKSDTVTLWSPGGEVLDTTSWVDPGAEVSWCRSPDTTGPFGTCSVATPGAENP